MSRCGELNKKTLQFQHVKDRGSEGILELFRSIYYIFINRSISFVHYNIHQLWQDSHNNRLGLVP